MDNKYNNFIPKNWLYIVFSAILIVLFFINKNYFSGFIGIAGLFLIFLYYLFSSRMKKNEWKKFIEDFSTNLNIANQDSIVRLPFPLIMIGNRGSILWYNQNMAAVLEGEDVLGKNINSLTKDFNTKMVLEGKKITFEHVKIKNRYFNIYTSSVDAVKTDKGNEKIVLLYLYDVTSTMRLINTVGEEREAVMLLEVDNLDEAVKSIEEDKKPLLIAEIERTINTYAQNLQAMMRKYSSNKYVLTVQEKDLKNEMEKKFEILDIVREINIGNKLTVTLSIGVGKGGRTPFENHSFATSAKELALGRGGDQVVVKNGEKLSFYGGKTKEVEKRTKVRARVIAHALDDLINESSKVFIMGHKIPDIDCLGSAVGINSAVKLLNKECYIVVQSSNTSIKPIMEKILEDEDYGNVFIDEDKCKEMIDRNSLLIIVDVHSRGYVQSEDIVNMIDRTVIIDHHRRSPDYIEGSLLSYVEPYASSTSEMVTEMLQYMVENPKIKSIEAEALLAGICVDTKNFCFKTGVRTFEAAGFLRKLGADTVDVKKLFSDDLSTYLQRAEIIKCAKVNNSIAVAISPDNIKDNVVVAQAADELLGITGIQASFVLFNIDNDIIISGRSLGDVNVQVILEELGGGGHMTMAGARLNNESMESALKKLKASIEKYENENKMQNKD